jgi:hypothetical protein
VGVGAFGFKDPASVNSPNAEIGPKLCAMKRLTPFGVLLIFGLIGLLTKNFGLWFAFGIVAFVVVGVMQNRREGPKPSAEKDGETKDGEAGV